jgi:hypothetical protein
LHRQYMHYLQKRNFWMVKNSQLTWTAPFFYRSPRTGIIAATEAVTSRWDAAKVWGVSKFTSW